MKDIRIGILGYGTVGSGVIEGLHKNYKLIFERTGIKITIAKVADIDILSNRGINLSKNILTNDSESVIFDESIDIVVELIGGITVAKELVMKSLSAGKPVVTANKALIAEYGSELFNLAIINNTGIYYEASVAGGIPVLKSLQDGLITNDIKNIYGILNGTCNYILSRMENEELSFNEVLADAQKLGYAETPPDLDIDGIDTAHKSIILASMICGTMLPMDSCFVSGIRDISKIDIKNSIELGYIIKLLALIKKNNNEVEISVEPTLVPKKHLISSVADSFNAVFIEGDIVGETMFYGRGAGKLPTGSAVIADIVDAAKDVINNKGTSSTVNIMMQNKVINFKSYENVRKRCYIRLLLDDLPGSMASVMKIFADNRINIASVLQKEHHQNGKVPVVILTENSIERDYDIALNEINKLEISHEFPIRFRIEDFDNESC